MNQQSMFQREKQWFIKNLSKYNGILLILLGIISTIWYIIRVVPKPSRATYPCMQLAAPFATTFITYFSVFITSLVIYKKAIDYFTRSRYLPGFVMLFIALLSGGIYLAKTDPSLNAANDFVASDHPVNDPIGIAKGIHPGRVAWVWSPESTNENCSNSAGDYWWQSNNTDQARVDQMVSDGLYLITEESNDSLAWDEIFRYYNATHGNGNHGFLANEKIVIKVNICSGGWGNVNEDTYEKVNWIGMVDTSPQMIIAVLKQLVDVFGVPQENISVGDPHRLFFDHYWDMCHSLYPQVNYLDWLGKLGRTKVVASAEPVLFYSDGTQSDSLPTAYIDADYMINIAALKQHDCAGGTFCVKNHFGSLMREMAGHMHYSLPSPTPNGFENLGMGKYRNLVDLAGHKDLGEKTALFMIDGLWGGDLPVADPMKWQSEPFNNDWPSSLFVSLDPIAIESVGLDFVRAEFPIYAHMDGSDDYLHQAASSDWWPDDIEYDPENDGVLLHSLGVHEHWNNNTDKQYSRNLGTGQGIELVQHHIFTFQDEDHPIVGIKVWPNPCRNEINFELNQANKTIESIQFISLNGQLLYQYRPNKESGSIKVDLDHYIPADSQTILYRVIFKDTDKYPAISGKFLYL